MRVDRIEIFFEHIIDIFFPLSMITTPFTQFFITFALFIII